MLGLETKQSGSKLLSTYTYIKITVNVMMNINNLEVICILNLKFALFLSVPEEKF